MNKKTLALTSEQYIALISAIRDGFPGSRPNPRIATALVLEGNLGLRISDILNLHLNDFVWESGRYRLDIFEIKTGKPRTFTVLASYCEKKDIAPDELIFPLSSRTIQATIKRACAYLNYTGISTHSFRKYYATEIYKNSNYNIALVQTLLQHSSPATTQKYIGLQTKEIEDAIMGHVKLL